MNNANNHNKFVILDTGASSTYSPLPTRVCLTAGANRVPVLHSAAKTPVIYTQTYPRYMTEERSEKTHSIDSGASQQFYPSPIIYTLEFRQAWKTIVDEHNNTTQKKSKKRNRRSSR